MTHAKGSHLVALVSLGAYLLANTQVGLVLAAALLPAAGQHCSCSCQHCSEHRHQGEKPVSRVTTRPCDSDDSDCPRQPCCPCPGGCALCSVAKVPCLTSLGLAVHPAPCVGSCLPDEAFHYVAPSSGPLMRPPRAAL